MDAKGTNDRASRPPAARAGRWLLKAVLLYFEIGIGISIVAIVAEAVAPALAARGYHVRTGGGFMLCVALGAGVAIYPTIWLDRLRRRWLR